MLLITCKMIDKTLTFSISISTLPKWREDTCSTSLSISTRLKYNNISILWCGVRGDTGWFENATKYLCTEVFCRIYQGLFLSINCLNAHGFISVSLLIIIVPLYAIHNTFYFSSTLFFEMLHPELHKSLLYR